VNDVAENRGENRDTRFSMTSLKMTTSYFRLPKKKLFWRMEPIDEALDLLQGMTSWVSDIYEGVLVREKVEFQYEREKNLEDRRKIVARFQRERPGLTPVIVEYNGKTKKYACSEDTTWAVLFNTLRKLHKIESEHAVYMFVDGTSLPVLSSTVSSSPVRDDGLIYVRLVREVTFG
jgi:hypothetical protein